MSVTTTLFTARRPKRAKMGSIIAALVALAVLIILPLFNLPLAAQAAISLGLIFAIAAVGLDVFMGYAGQVSFGHFGFVAVGAYVPAIVQAQWGWSVWATLPLALAASALTAVILGVPMIRLPQLGSSLVSFFFAFIVIVLINGPLLVRLTQGESGLGTGAAAIGDTNLDYGVPLYYFALICLVIVVALSLLYVSSWSGRMLRVIRHNETVATSLGAPVRAMKLWSLVFSATCAGLAGFVLGQSLGILSPGAFDPFESIYLATMVVVGGLGSIFGPIAGALFFTIVNQLSFGAGAASGVVFAVILLVVLILLPGGVRSAVAWLIRRIRHRSGQSTAPAAAGFSRQDADELAALFVARDDAREVIDHASTDVLLDVSECTVRFGGVTALDSVNLRATRGSVHGIVGPNGAGKTTLLNAICRLGRFDGSITLDGESIATAPARRLRAMGVARSFQHPSLARGLSAQENVALGLYTGRPALTWSASGHRFRKEAQERVHEVLRLARIPEGRWTIAAEDLSLAELKALDVARALVGAPKLLLMDEPTAGLESDEMDAMADLINAARARGITVLVISHHVGFLQKLADEVTVLDFGRVIANGPFAEVFARKDVLDAFMGATT